MDSKTEVVYVWCDGTWCFQEDLEYLLMFMSDDYKCEPYDPFKHD